ESGILKGRPRSVTTKLDRSVAALVWAVDSNTIFFPAEENAGAPIFTVYVKDAEIEKLHVKHTAGSLSISRDGNCIAFTRTAYDRPAKVCMRPPIGANATVTPPTPAFLSDPPLPRPESVSVKGAGGTPMHMWILKPPGFDPKKKWPLVYLVHGGPQGAWEDGW